jgi:hypothetical protein
MKPSPTPHATNAMIDCAGKASIAIFTLKPASRQSASTVS